LREKNTERETQYNNMRTLVLAVCRDADCLIMQ
jgi:hypothetical protein